MKQFRKNDRAMPASGGARFIRFACSAMLCLAIMTAQANAQKYTKPAKQDCSGAAKSATGKSKDKGSCGGEAKAAAPSPASKTAATAATGDDNAPRWACAKPTVTFPPLWQGTPVECSFDIRNEGKSDLKIKANGG